MHVLLILVSYPDERRPHAGIFFRDQAKALAEAGHRVGLIVPRVTGYRSIVRLLVGGGRIRKYEECQGVLVLERDSLSWCPRSRRSRHQAFLTAGRLLYADYIRQFGRPDILHAQIALPAGVLAAELSRVHRIPFVITEHSSHVFRDDLSKWQREAVSDAYGQSGASIAVSEPFRTALAKRFPNVHMWDVVPNVVSPDFLLTPMGSGSGTPVFLSVGALIANKGGDILLRAFAVVLQNIPDARLRMVGGGPERLIWQRLAVSLGIDGQVSFTGVLRREQVTVEMQGATCFVSASRMETFGLAIVEAMAMGLPVVVTRCGGPEDTVNLESGVLVPTDDVPALAAGMLAMVNRAPGDRVSIRAACERRFGSVAIARRLTAIYDSVVARSTGG